MTENSGYKGTRMSLRAHVNFPCTFENPEFRINGRVIQLSEGGMLFSCVEDLKVNTKGIFTLRVFKEDSPVWVSGEVIYKLEERVKTSPQNRYGIRFKDMNDAIKEMIGRALRSEKLRERYSSKNHTEDDEGA
jgi:c-di-GMP-binding flagellar brake protein YcgR